MAEIPKTEIVLKYIESNFKDLKKNYMDIFSTVYVNEGLKFSKKRTLGERDRLLTYIR